MQDGCRQWVKENKKFVTASIIRAMNDSTP
jgi:hypothetical protein